MPIGCRWVPKVVVHQQINVQLMSQLSFHAQGFLTDYKSFLQKISFLAHHTPEFDRSAKKELIDPPDTRRISYIIPIENREMMMTRLAVQMKTIDLFRRYSTSTDKFLVLIHTEWIRTVSIERY